MAIRNEDIKDLALSYVGRLNYDFGADNIDGGVGDCSSFTSHIYRKFGYDIGRDTISQLANTVEVSADEREIGDLVFFAGTYRDGVSHVGIYIGNDEFVHLNDGRGCCINSLNDWYYKKHYLSTGRVEEIETTEVDTSKEKNSAGLKWWGDIVRVVVLILLIILSLVFMGTAVGVKIKGGK